jgi:aminoglycoside/choline kinase family phosphotransferase
MHLAPAQWQALVVWHPEWRERPPAAEPLVSDASSRRYVRLTDTNGSVVVMARTEPFDPDTDDFLRLATFFSDYGWPVPAVWAVLPEVGLVVLEDLGNTSLHATGDLAHYEAAVDLLIDLQRIGPAANPATPPWRRRFDAPFFQRELTLFIDAFQVLTGSRDRARRDVFLQHTTSLCGALADLPLVVCHRDYHRRNLLIADGRIRPIDFQDARLGPRAYDLVSLLEDPYAGLDAAQRRHLLDRYRAASDSPLSDGEYALAACQRLLKAAGTYANQAVTYHNDAYLPYLAPALASAQLQASRLSSSFAATVHDLLTTWEERQ